MSPYLHSEVTLVEGEHLKHWVKRRLLFKTGRCTIKAAEFMQATMVEEEQRVFIAIDESTAHGTYNNRSFGLAPSVFSPSLYIRVRL